VREILNELWAWSRAGHDLALATVVRTVGSSPRPVGSKMLMSARGDVAGSVSGGCVEGAVLEVAEQVMKTGRPRHLRFGVADEEAWAVGLSCGGTIQVFVERVESEGSDGGPSVHGLAERVGDGARGVVVTRVGFAEDQGVAGDSLVEDLHGGARLLIDAEGLVHGSLGSASLDAAARREASRRQGAAGKEGGSGLSKVEGVQLFFEVLAPRPRLIIVGAVHIAISLARLARELDFSVTVVDARDRFATRARFPDVEQLLVGWPGEVMDTLELDDASHVVVITHDAKLDNPALRAALSRPVPYVGALGSRRTHERRLAALRDDGVDEVELARIHAPIGLEIGARTPAEIALATMAQIVAVRRGVSSQ
jgi:xanthine dehydrogenase accessory factor